MEKEREGVRKDREEENRRGGTERGGGGFCTHRTDGIKTVLLQLLPQRFFLANSLSSLVEVAVGHEEDANGTSISHPLSTEAVAPILRLHHEIGDENGEATVVDEPVKID